jgi:hypothetical protein
MATFIFAYFGIALLALACDGMLCYAMERRFRFLSSAVACLFWFIVLPVVVVVAWRQTRHLPAPGEQDDIRAHNPSESSPTAA